MRPMIMVFWGLVAALAFGFAGPSKAGAEACVTSVQGESVVLYFDPDDTAIDENYGWREKVFGVRGDIDCPAYVTLRYLTPGLRDKQRRPFCLRYDEVGQTYLGYDQGERAVYLTCKVPSRSFCERVNGSAEVATDVIQRGLQTAEYNSGVASMIQQGSGAVILSGSGGQVAGALASLGSSAAAVLTAPATLAAAAVTVVAVGGVLYVCHQ